jgi:hypothetical protein
LLGAARKHAELDAIVFEHQLLHQIRASQQRRRGGAEAEAVRQGSANDAANSVCNRRLHVRCSDVAGGAENASNNASSMACSLVSSVCSA